MSPAPHAQFPGSSPQAASYGSRAMLTPSTSGCTRRARSLQRGEDPGLRLPYGADGERGHHSGYTNAQYRSLASQIAQWKVLYGIGSGLVATHQEVDRSGSRRDPRSFN
ncbi:hypothetical protein KBY83_15120 [Cyanobium sp. WKJ7-Wakatipu]|uniref:hypothetical protein n=1 Tax=Cyanobium sp. WKJ7-Wakatipu TaxID=2823726 RepID=UPI0020CF59B6|nr:hypothetical protein [Cyanobium sp. WKJ7-Wakatipu]MCP9784621.1 hypothetical protein [Cyanobium sp. WKJ7-Wakatipu]